jgi:hypothetical protein
MNVRLKHDMHFTAGVYYNGELRMNNYSLRLWMITNTYDASSHNISFDRIKYFIYSEMDSTIFINGNDEEQCQLLVDAGLGITTLPGEPVDQLVGLMLYYKLNAITETRMTIVETELGSIMGDSMSYLHSENETTEDVVRPDWWASTDLVHCDTNLIDPDKVVMLHQSSVWRDLDLAWPDVDDGENATGNTVVFADFKSSDDTK